MEFPDDVRYTTEHEWVRLDGGTARVGITDYAQDSLGDVVFVDLPDEGLDAVAGASVCEVESTKAVSEIYAPVTGEITAVNAALDDTPELLNTDPFGEGWIFEMAPSDTAEVESLLDASAYRAHTES
ncbi:MAG: glycine cleavage system protein GcvH [Acidimicrobiia bacterium]